MPALLLGLWLAFLPIVQEPPEIRFDVRELDGQGGAQLPVTLSALLPAGRFHDGDVAVVVRDAAGGAPAVVPAQLDVLSRHDDGSLQHALVTLRMDLKPRATHEVYLVPSPAAPLAGPLAAPLAGVAQDVVVELVDRAGDHWTALLSPPPPDQPAEDPGARAGPLWGPLVQEVERVAALRSPKGALANVQVRVRWRRFAGLAGARVEVVVENVPPPRADGPGPDDVECQRVAIFAGDRPLLDRRDVVLHDRCRFVVRGFSGAALPRLMVREDLATLIRLGWLPPLDARRPIPDAQATEEARRIVKNDSNGEVDPAFPLGIPLDSGPIVRYMPTTGDRGDIGPVPDWAALALNSRSVFAEDVLLAADYNGAAAFPIHVRADDGLMGIDFAAAKPMEDRHGHVKCPNTPDRAHAPLVGFTSFLLTGDRFAEEELAAQAAYVFYEWPHEGRYRYPGSRDFAWSLRTSMLAAKVLPDANPLKPYLQERVAENLKELRRITSSESPLHAWGSGSWQSSGRRSWPCATQWSPWQATWVCASLEWTARLLGNADARAMFEWQAQYFVRAYAEIGQTFTAPDGTQVTWQDGDQALAYSFPVAVYAGRIEGKEWKPQEGSHRAITSFAEALWYLRVNLDREFDPGKLPETPTGEPPYAPERWRPKGAWSPPPPPEASWVEYAMRWLAPVLAADGMPGGERIWKEVRPSVERQVPIAGLRYVPEMLAR